MALGPAALYGYMLLPGLPNQLAGGAFLLAPDIAVTCAHVVRNHLGLGEVTPKQAPKEKIKLRFPAVDLECDGKVIPGGWHADPEHGGSRLLRDVALIRLSEPVQDPELLYIPMAVTSPPAEGKGWIVGAGPGWQEYGQEIGVQLGHAPNARGHWSLTDLHGHGMTAVPGFSGSPLLGESMTVIWGMVQRVAGSGHRTTLVLASDRLHEALKAAGIAPGTSARRFPRLGISVIRGGLGNDQRVDETVEIAPVDGAKPTKARTGKAAGATRTQHRNWGLDRLNILPLWALGLRGEGVRIGDISTGIEASHRLLKGRVAAYALFDNNGKLVPDAEPEDTTGVGTHTAGILVGSDEKTQLGIAPKAELYVAQAIEGGQILHRILAGLDWMLQHKVSVVNLSLGLRGYSPIFESAIAALRDADVICVASVGNEGPGTSRSPGNYRDVISVGAIDQQDRVADFSGSQHFGGTEPFSVPSVVAPGVNIKSATCNAGLSSMDGTSAAAPHVAGLAALLRQAAPKASATDIREAIFASCLRSASQVPERVGRGVPNGAAAVRILAGRSLIDARFLARWSP